MIKKHKNEYHNSSWFSAAGKRIKTKYRFHILSFLVPVILYAHTIGFGFTDFDDNRLIKDNIGFLSDYGNVFKAFGTDAFLTGTSNFYRPIQVVSFMTDILISGGIHTWMFHLSSVLFFGALSCALYVFLKIFLPSAPFAFLITLMFTAHPLFVPVVTWIPARGDLLLTLFALISFISLNRYLRFYNPAYLLIHSLSFLLALFCKETGAMLPFIFIVYMFLKGKSQITGTKVLFLPAIYLIIGVVWFWLRADAINDFSPNIHSDEIFGWIPFVNNLRIIPEGIFRFILPVNPGPLPSFSILAAIGGMLLLAVLVILTAINNSIDKEASIISFLWFLLLMIPPLFFKHKLIDYLDHRFILPMIGLLPLTLILRPLKPGTEYMQGGLKWTGISLILIFAGLTIYKSRFYSDPETFYTSAIKYNPSSSIAHNNLGAVYHNRGDYKNAIYRYTMAIRIKSDYINAINNRANAYLLSGSYKEAVVDYSLVIRMDPTDAHSYNNRGVAFLRIHQKANACKDFSKGVELGSTSAADNLKRFCR